MGKVYLEEFASIICGAEFDAYTSLSMGAINQGRRLWVENMKMIIKQREHQALLG